MNSSAEKAGFVIASKYRREILIYLMNGEKTPNQIGQKLNLISVQSSRTLRELLEKELIVCLNPNAKKGRLYSITEEGKSIANRLLGDNYE